jgi:general stress protein 26
MEIDYGVKNLFDVVDDFDTAMLVTHTGTMFHARPMAIAQLDYGLGAYLVTDVNSLKIVEICINQGALLTFQSARRFASVRGKLEIVSDHQLVEKVWKAAWIISFPGGTTDPNIALLKFTAHEGEFWDNSGVQGLKYVYEAAKAYVTGEKVEPDATQNAKVTL